MTITRSRWSRCLWLAAVGFVSVVPFVSPTPTVLAKAQATTLLPAPGSTGVPTNTDLLMKFDEVMKAEDGNISIWKVNFPVTGSTTAAQIKANTTKVEEFKIELSSKWDLSTNPPLPPKVNMGDKKVDGTSRQAASEADRWVRITINPLAANTSYYVRIETGVFETAGLSGDGTPAGTLYGIESETTWLFTTGAGPTTTTTTAPGATTTLPSVTTTVPVAATCQNIVFPGRAPRLRLDATQSQFSSKSLACSIGVITRSKLIAVAVSSAGTISNSSVTSYTVKAARIGGSFVSKPLTPVAGSSVQRTQFGPLKTGSWTVTVTGIGPTGAVVAEWTSAAFRVSP